MSQLRAFLAIDVDEDIKAKMYKIIKEFKQIDANIKYVDLENIHLTLKFFGEIDSEGIELLSSKIESVVSNFDKFTIKIKGCGAFPNTNRIKVIWLGIDGDEVIKQLHDELDKEFVKIGFDKDKILITPDNRQDEKCKRKNKVKSTIEEFSEVEVGQMDVDRIILKKSTLTPAGPIYEDLKTFEL